MILSKAVSAFSKRQAYRGAARTSLGGMQCVPIGPATTGRYRSATLYWLRCHTSAAPSPALVDRLPTIPEAVGAAAQFCFALDSRRALSFLWVAAWSVASAPLQSFPAILRSEGVWEIAIYPVNCRPRIYQCFEILALMMSTGIWRRDGADVISA